MTSVQSQTQTGNPRVSVFSLTSHDHEDASVEIEKHVSWDQVVGGCIGNILEWYDFGVFGFLTTELSNNFFPQQSNTAKVCRYHHFVVVAI